MPGDYRLVPASADPQTRLALRMADLESRLSRIEARGNGVVRDTYTQYGQNTAYVALAGSGQGLYVNAAQNIPLAWVYTPVVNVWAEVVTQVLFQNSGSAAWDTMVMTMTCTPAPASGPASHIAQVALHNALPAGQVLTIHGWFPLVAGTSYTVSMSSNNGGGNVMNYYQGANYMRMMGKAWER